jgi:hypothetical protein
MRLTDLATQNSFDAVLLDRDDLRCLVGTEAALPLDCPIQLALAEETWLAEVVGRTSTERGPALIVEIRHVIPHKAADEEQPRRSRAVSA